MGYRELIKKVQHYSGFSDAESKEALEDTVESLAMHLAEGERKDFASQLPPELQDIALSVEPTKEESRQDIIEQVMEIEGIEEDRAKKKVLSSWKALKEALTPGQIDHIKTQIPDKALTYLH